MSTMEIDENAYWDRMEGIASKCADDVMMIQKLADGDGHAAAVSCQLLAVLEATPLLQRRNQSTKSKIN